MNTVTTLEIASNSLEDTLKIGEKLGNKLKGGEVIELVSDIGGGKTALTKGIVIGTDSIDEVASPSFTISRHYKVGNDSFTIQHFDFYRLNNPGIIKMELTEALSDTKTTVIIEWSDIITDTLPEDRLQITIMPTGDTERFFSMKAGKTHARLLKELK